MLLNVFQKFERIELKDQMAKVKELKEISKKPDCKASPFRFLRSLEPDDMYDLLGKKDFCKRHAERSFQYKRNEASSRGVD